MAISPDGLLYVSDTGHQRIQVFGANGEFLRNWGNQGSGEGQFADPGAITVSASGLVYVADTKKFPYTGV